MTALFIAFLLTLINLPGRDNAVAAIPKFENLNSLEVKRFEQQSELSNLNIKTVIRDSTGYLWIGTQNGLNRYDGARVRQYFANPKDPSSLSDNYIQYLFVDSEGILWILVPDSFLRYNENTDSFTRYKFTDEKKNTHTSNPGAITEGSDGIIWIGTPEQGLYAFDKKTGKFEFKPLNAQNIDSMIFDDKGRLWIGSPGKVYVYNVGNNTYKELDVPLNEVVVSINPNQGQLLTRNSFFHIVENGNNIEFIQTQEKPPFITAEILSVLETDRFLFFGTRGKGVLQYSKEDRTFNSQQFENNSHFSIGDNTIRQIYEDKYGTVWLSTENGLNTIYSTDNKFTNYSYERGDLVSNLVTAFIEDPEGKIWISTFNGVNIYNPEDKTFDTITSVKNNKGGKIDVSNVRDIINDSHGNIWFLLKGGVIKYNPVSQTGEFYHIKYENSEASDLLSIYYADNSIWIGSYGNGVFRLNPVTGEVEECFNTFNSDISSDYIKEIIKLADGRYCFATLRTGIDIYDSKKHSFENKTFSDLTDNYVSDYINSILQDSNGNLWVLSWHGAFILDPVGEIILSLSTNDGLPSNELNAITEDQFKTIWIGTENGLARVYNYLEDLHLSNYTVEDGLTYNMVSTGALLSSKEGSIYIGTPNGIDLFENKLPPQEKRSEAPVLVGLKIYDEEITPGKKVDGRIILEKPLNELSKIRLNHNQNNISLVFASWDFNKMHTRRYSYKLEGVDKNWITTDSKGIANYNNLAPGKYLFRVKTMNVNGIWSPETVLEIKITPPWWITWWAITFYCLFAVFIGYSIFRFLRNREKMRQEMRISKMEREKENEIYEIKQRLYTNITHDMRTALTLISGPIKHALNNDELPDNIKEGFDIVDRNTGYLKSLIDQVLDFRKIEVGLVKPEVQKVEINSFLKGITQMFSSYAELKGIKLTCEVSEEKIFAYFDKSMMAKVMYNLLGNALKFTPENGEVKVVCYVENDKLIIIVKDTGIGMDESRISKIFEEFYQIYPTGSQEDSNYKAGSGIGLSIVKKYIELHKGTITVESELGKGSSFIISLDRDFAWSGLKEEPEEKVESALPEIELEHIARFDDKSDNNSQLDQKFSKDKETILIVDDNKDIIKYLQTCLENDFNVITAYNGKEGMQIALKELPDIIISDVMMPETDGFGFATMLKENELTRHIPILFLTAKTSHEDAINGLSLGAVDYLTKPFNEEILLAKLKNLIFDRNALREKIRHQLESGSVISSHIRNKDTAKDTAITDKTVSSTEAPADPFLNKVIDFINENLENPELSIDFILDHFKLSKMQLYRKLKAISDLTAGDLIREMRMKRAEELLREGRLNVSEIAYKLDFSDPFHFSKSFKKHTGMSPSEYKNQYSSIS